MNGTWKVAGAFLLALVAADTAASMLTNWLRSPEFAFSAVQSLWLGWRAGQAIAEAVVLAGVFCLAGAGLALLMPQPFERVGPSLALGAAYSLALFLFMPYLPGGLEPEVSSWVAALAAAPYLVPPAAGASGAALVAWSRKAQSGQHAA